jgi:hypothetical protein
MGLLAEIAAIAPAPLKRCCFEQVIVYVAVIVLEIVDQAEFGEPPASAGTVDFSPAGRRFISNWMGFRIREKYRLTIEPRRSVCHSTNRSTEDQFWTTDINLPVDTAKAIVGLGPSFSAHVRLGERGAPVDSL